jgi:DNA-directed RNA polymerase specialized sigma subunit
MSNQSEAVPLHVVSDHELVDSFDVLEHVSDEIAKQRMRRDIRRLPVIERKVLAWRYGLLDEWLTVRQVAARLNVAPSTAHAIQERALAALESDSVALLRAVA